MDFLLYGSLTGIEIVRILLLVLNSVASLFLATDTSDVLAALATGKDKGQQHYHVSTKENKTKNPGDVWDRIPSGMKTPGPSATQDQAAQASVQEHNRVTNNDSLHSESGALNSTTMNARGATHAENAESEKLATLNRIIPPHTAVAPIHNYTDLGHRLRFGTDKPSTRGVLAASEPVKQQKPDYELIKKNISINFGDVWERIRLGMKIPWPRPTQALPGQVLISEKNSLAIKTTGQYAADELVSDAAKNHEARLTEKAGSVKQVASKYVIQPHAIVPPSHNYTALGRRLRFGANNSSAANGNCTLPITAQAQLQQTTNNLMPCSDRAPLHRVEADKQDKRGHVTEQIGTQKALIDERINKQIIFYSQNPDYLYRVAERARPYLYHIVEQLSKNQMPLELALLPIVESAYQPNAVSPKGAAGLWQFIPSTGKDFDLKQSNQYDERFDLAASTHAAIRYLSYLKDHFKGDWMLALAAYNCGQGAVDAAISRNHADGLDTGYWSLHLPEETQNYVPRFVALSNIFANPAKYGLKFAPIKNEPYFVKVKNDRGADAKYLIN